uniref:Uncharacterized protein n=1 Tax=Arundo donax TaxID=35708 RepID=A0A0A8YRW5_ARUDO
MEMRRTWTHTPSGDVYERALNRASSLLPQLLSTSPTEAAGPGTCLPRHQATSCGSRVTRGSRRHAELLLWNPAMER